MTRIKFTNLKVNLCHVLNKIKVGNVTFYSFPGLYTDFTELLILRSSEFTFVLDVVALLPFDLYISVVYNRKMVTSFILNRLLMIYRVSRLT